VSMWWIFNMLNTTRRRATAEGCPYRTASP
jgi:hypothetical protein